jgi:pantothenate synthetase
MQIISLRMAGVCTVVIMLFSLLATPAFAQSFSQSAIDEQKRLILVEMVSTLEQHVKLLQMLIINQLEAEVARLQADIAAQNS